MFVRKTKKEHTKKLSWKLNLIKVTKNYSFAMFGFGQIIVRIHKVFPLNFPGKIKLITLVLRQNQILTLRKL